MEIKYVTEPGLTTVFTIVKDQINSAVSAIPEYVLPVASTTTLGGVKAGTGISIAADGTISATGTAAVDPTALPLASKTQKGAVIIGDGIEMVDGKITVTHPDVYTKAEADAKYQTAEQVESIAAAKVAAVVDGAPEAFDTLKELADALNEDKDGSVVNGLVKTIGAKANAADVYTKAQTDSAIDTAKSELNAEIAKKATPADVATAKSEAIAAAATAGDAKYVAKTDMPTFTAYTAAEIQAIADAVFGA